MLDYEILCYYVQYGDDFNMHSEYFSTEEKAIEFFKEVKKSNPKKLYLRKVLNAVGDF